MYMCATQIVRFKYIHIYIYIYIYIYVYIYIYIYIYIMYTNTIIKTLKVTNNIIIILIMSIKFRLKYF